MANNANKKAVSYNDGVYAGILAIAAGVVLLTAGFVTWMCLSQYETLIKAAGGQ